MIHPEDIEVGSFITVDQWKPREIIGRFGDGFGGGVGLNTTTIQDRSYCGRPLRVICIQLPYIICKELGNSISKKPFSLDTREVNLLVLKPSYVASYLGLSENSVSDKRIDEKKINPADLISSNVEGGE